MTPNYQAGDRAQGTRQGNGYGSRNRATSPARRSSICVLSPTSASRSSRSRSRESFTKRRVRSTDHDPIGAIKAMPKVALPPGRTDQDFILGLLRETGVLCVYGSGFGTAPADGFFRIVFLASPSELNTYFDAIEAFTGTFLSR